MKTDKLRIAQVAPLWTPIPPRTYGGIELLMKLHIDELVARGHGVTLFSSADSKTAARLHEVLEMNLTDLVTDSKAFMFEYYANSTMAEALCAQNEFDILHFHLGTAWLPLAASARTPSLFTVHTSPHIDDEWVMRRWPQVAVNGISRCQMHGTALKLGREFPIVYNGCDFAAYEPCFEPGKYLAFLGRLSPAKNPLDAIRIAQAVEMPIVLAGQPQNANEERYFAEQIAPLIDDDRVRWIGAVNHMQKNELLRNAAALLFPIQWEEPFGLVMIEAMACGTPVVAHRRGSVEEVVENGVTGYHAGIIDGMAELVPRALELDRRQVREHAQSRFSFQQMVDDYLALYRSVIAAWRK
jgi:glycosyltransferase involved in cell wall biosynthesis